MKFGKVVWQSQVAFLVVILVACSGDGSSTGANGDSDNGGGSEYDASSNTLKDSRDGKTYKTVKIGNQVWMAENLDYEMGNAVCGEKEYLTLYGCLYSWDEAKTACAFRNGARRISRLSVREPFFGVPLRSMTTSQSPWFCVTKTMQRHCSKTTRTPVSVSAA